MNISIITPINSLGYGYAGLHIVDELMNLNHKVALFPIGKVECHFRHEKNIREALSNADQFNINAPCIRIWHQHDMSMFVGKGCHVGFPIFELDTFTDKEKHHLHSCDKLFVCSKWGKGIIDQNLGTHSKRDVGVVPLGVDTSIFTPVLSKRKATIFINVGKWEIRKGHDVLPKIFNDAFLPSDNVELWMMCDNCFITSAEEENWKSMYKNTPLGDKIRFIPRVESDNQVADIMKQVDCGVFPSRAEGYCIPAIELLSCGKELIITDYSAHTEFCTKDNSMLVPINGLEPAYDGRWFFGQGQWGKIDDNTISLFVKHMRKVHDTKQSRTLEINHEGVETAHKFCWSNTAKTIVEYLN